MELGVHESIANFLLLQALRSFFVQTNLSRGVTVWSERITHGMLVPLSNCNWASWHVCVCDKTLWYPCGAGPCSSNVKFHTVVRNDHVLFV